MHARSLKKHSLVITLECSEIDASVVCNMCSKNQNLNPKQEDAIQTFKLWIDWSLITGRDDLAHRGPRESFHNLIFFCLLEFRRKRRSASHSFAQEKHNPSGAASHQFLHRTNRLQNPYKSLPSFCFRGLCGVGVSFTAHIPTSCSDLYACTPKSFQSVVFDSLHSKSLAPTNLYVLQQFLSSSEKEQLGVERFV